MSRLIRYEHLKFNDVLSHTSTTGVIHKGEYQGEKVVIKTIKINDPDEMKLVQREMAIHMDLQYPNIVNFLGFCKQGNTLHLVTQYIESVGHLGKVLRNIEYQFNWRFRLQIAFDIASLLEYLHTKNIIHRDLRSKNFLLNVENSVILTDLGLARFLETSKQMTYVGGNDWMAPEVVLGKTYNEKADIFSFGIILVELVTRAKPSHYDLKRELAGGFGLKADVLLAVAPKDTPPKLLELILDCCEYDPNSRPSIVQALETLTSIIIEVEKYEQIPIIHKLDPVEFERLKKKKLKKRRT